MELSRTQDVAQLVLASSSPARRNLLVQLGVNPLVQATDVDETALDGESAPDLVVRLAQLKAQAAAELVETALDQNASSPGMRLDPAVVVGADTIATVDGQVLGKPQDDGDARSMLAMLSGRSHLIHTGVAVQVGTQVVCGLDSTEVWFRSLGSAEIDQYVAAGESSGRAGAYGIQGRASLFVQRLDGSFSGVVGLPLALVESLLGGFGRSLTEWITSPSDGHIGVGCV